MGFDGNGPPAVNKTLTQTVLCHYPCVSEDMLRVNLHDSVPPVSHCVSRFCLHEVLWLPCMKACVIGGVHVYTPPPPTPTFPVSITILSIRRDALYGVTTNRKEGGGRQGGRGLACTGQPGGGDGWSMRVGGLALYNTRLSSA